MTTRSLTAVKINNEYKIAQYGHFDGYPQGQGIYALEFLLHKMKKEKFTKKLLKMEFTQTDNESYEALERQSNYDGAKILNYFQNRKDNKAINQLNFAESNIVCEWAYVIDFDTNTFEVYSGYYRSMQYKSSKKRKEFKNLNLLKVYNLNNLPSKEKFQEDFAIL